MKEKIIEFDMEKKIHVLVTGCTGVGKSTIIEELNDSLRGFNVYIFSDPYASNPFIEKAYTGGGYYFQSELFFIKEFLRIQNRIESLSSGIVIQERSIYECVFIFCRQFLEHHKINKDEYELFIDLFDLLRYHMKRPDCVVYLQASPEVIFDRVKNRGRSFEATIDLDFIKHQNQLYDNWIDHFTRDYGMPLLQIDCGSNNAHNCAEAIKRRILYQIMEKQTIGPSEDFN